MNERQLKIKILKLQIKMNAAETITILSVAVHTLCSNVLQTGDGWTILMVLLLLFYFFRVFLRSDTVH